MVFKRPFNHQVEFHRRGTYRHTLARGAKPLCRLQGNVPGDMSPAPQHVTTPISIGIAADCRCIELKVVTSNGEYVVPWEPNSVLVLLQAKKAPPPLTLAERDFESHSSRTSGVAVLDRRVRI
jgi:hypothetical protein